MFDFAKIIEILAKPSGIELYRLFLENWVGLPGILATDKSVKQICLKNCKNFNTF